MRIGIDAKWFFNGPPSGRIVVYNLVKYLIASNIENDFFIFLDKKDRKHKFPFINDRVHLIYLWGGNNLLSNVFFVPILGYKHKIEVFIAQYFSPFFSSFKRISFIYDISFVSNPAFFTKRELLYFLSMKTLSKRAHKISTISISEKQRLIKYNYNKPGNIHIVPIGIDNNKFKPRCLHNEEIIRATRERYKLPEEYLLYLGRFNIRKNIDNLLKSITLLKNKTIPLILAGKYDWKMFDISEIINRYNLANRTRIIGYVEEEHLPALFSLAKIFCYVSYDEGFGIPPLEAMASGVPVVVSDIDPHKEVCGPAGCYVNPKDPRDIAREIDDLIVNEKLYKEKMALGLERARLFSWENSTRALLDCISSIS